LNNTPSFRVAIIGAGLAGSEAALILAGKNCAVDLYEMRPEKMTPAHTTGNPAELVCSNSFKTTALPSAHGLLKKELEYLESPLIECAKKTAVPAGSALAVDREKFSREVSRLISNAETITRKTAEVDSLPRGYDYTIIATGPLTSEAMTTCLQDTFDAREFNFYDAVAPIIDYESIDMDRAFMASRWNKGTADYINCPFTKDEYDQFYTALVEADRVKKHDFETEDFFEACLPIEVMAHRGYDTLRFGMMKPVGLKHPRTGEEFFAVCQLRRENKYGTAYNMVGFQTRMTYAEQKHVFSLIPGLEGAEYLRFGTIHRNSYVNSPNLLKRDLSFKTQPDTFLAGQLTGNEGYAESIATGNIAARSVIARFSQASAVFPDATTTLGGLLDHIVSTPETGKFTPTNVNFGLLAPPHKKMRKRIRKEYYCSRALETMESWKNANVHLF
jgi:methylenetetrahydrofolate--tRNA-(uracil-5-)-methyltransferase